jgi:Na+:H+ antiporter, NhaA family
VGVLGGIGFTMSIFIANLAFKETALIQFSKVAVLTGSLFACILGLLVLYGVTQKKLGPTKENEKVRA